MLFDYVETSICVLKILLVILILIKNTTLKNTITQLLSLLFATIILVSCNKFKENTPKNSIEVVNDSEGYFKGIIKLEEKDWLGTESNITLIFNGDDVKREVTQRLFSNVSYGMIYRKGKDSVEYYYTKDDKTWHTLIAKKDFQKWVTKLERPVIDSTNIGSSTLIDNRPFGDIFKFFNSSATDVTSTIVNSTLKNCTSVRCQTFLVPQNGVSSCNVWYSEDIKIRPEILEIIEHNQPTSIKTLALQVEYFSPKVSTKNTLDKVLDKVNKVLVKTGNKIHLNSVNSTDNVSIELPKNSVKVASKDFNIIVHPKVESSGSSDGGGSYDD